MGSITFRDVAYFLAEVAVYVAVVWWGFSRAVPSVARWGLGVGLLAVFAVSLGSVCGDRCLATAARVARHGVPRRLVRSRAGGGRLARCCPLNAAAAPSFPPPSLPASSATS